MVHDECAVHTATEWQGREACGTVEVCSRISSVTCAITSAVVE